MKRNEGEEKIKPLQISCSSLLLFPLLYLSSMDTKPISSAASSAAPMPPSSAVAGMGASGTMLAEGMNIKQNNNIHNNSNLASAGGPINPIHLSSSVLASSTAPPAAASSSSSSAAPAMSMEAGKNSISNRVLFHERDVTKLSRSPCYLSLARCFLIDLYSYCQ